MLPLACVGAVNGHNSPVVGEHLGLDRTGDEHRFDSESHAGLDLRSHVTHSVVQHVRCHVHLRTDTVTHVVFNDAVLIAVFFGHVRFDGKPDFADLLCGCQGGNTVPHCLTGDGGELGACFAHVANQYGARRIAVPLAVGCGINNVRTTVDGENVAILEHVVAGDTVNNLVVDGGAYGCRVIVVAVEVGGATQFQHGAFKGCVHLCGGYAGARCRHRRIKCTAGNDACTSHLLKLCVGFNFDSCHSGSLGMWGGTPKLRTLQTALYPRKSL